MTARATCSRSSSVSEPTTCSRLRESHAALPTICLSEALRTPRPLLLAPLLRAHEPAVLLGDHRGRPVAGREGGGHDEQEHRHEHAGRKRRLRAAARERDVGLLQLRGRVHQEHGRAQHREQHRDVDDPPPADALPTRPRSSTPARLTSSTSAALSRNARPMATNEPTSFWWPESPGSDGAPKRCQGWIITEPSKTIRPTVMTALRTRWRRWSRSCSCPFSAVANALRAARASTRSSAARRSCSDACAHGAIVLTSSRSIFASFGTALWRSEWTTERGPTREPRRRASASAAGSPRARPRRAGPAGSRAAHRRRAPRRCAAGDCGAAGACSPARPRGGGRTGRRSDADVHRVSW